MAAGRRRRGLQGERVPAAGRQVHRRRHRERPRVKLLLSDEVQQPYFRFGKLNACLLLRNLLNADCVLGRQVCVLFDTPADVSAPGREQFRKRHSTGYGSRL